jgi:hypothetical protein
METGSIKTINAHQQQIYDWFEKETVAALLEGYDGILKKVKCCSTLKIIDLGGGGGILPYPYAATSLIKAANCLW